MIKKIIEIKGTDWLKGYSQQPTLPIGGIFQAAINFDPFETMGHFQASFTPTELTAPSASGSSIDNWQASGVPYFYVKTSSGASSKLYQYLRNSPYTQTDVSAQATLYNAFNKSATGSLIWGNRYIYADRTAIYSNTLPVDIGNEVVILNGTNVIGGNGYVRRMAIGADKNLYMGESNEVAKMTTSTIAANGVLAYFTIDVGYNIRDLWNNGKYLVIIADNNDIDTTAVVPGDNKCRVYFWDMGKATADIIWDIKDSYLIGGGFFDGKNYIFGYNGIYVCNEVTSPKMIWDFTGNSTITKRPSNPYQITIGKDAIYWGDAGTSGQNIYAIKGSVVYSPYQTHQSTEGHTAIQYSNGGIIAATSNPKLYIHNIGTARGNSTVSTVHAQLDKTCNMAFVKVVLKTALSSGQSVLLQVYNSNGSVISTSETKSFSVVGAKKTLIFQPTPPGVANFDDIYINLSAVAGAIVEKVVVYGNEVDDSSQIT